MKHFFVAGFDFGTSYSKVVLRDQLTGAAKAVTFGANGSGLLPSFVGIRDGMLVGPEANGGEIAFSFPKLVAADAASGRTDFLSLYDAKKKLIHEKLDETSWVDIARWALIRYFLTILDSIHAFIGNDEDWSLFDPLADPLVVQIAVPTGLTEQNPKIDMFFQSALAAATLARSKEGAANLGSSVSSVKAAWKCLITLNPQEREALDARCITYPEVAAGVQTVLRSPNTPDGKYITLDVGAGTVDLNAFYRHSAGETGGAKLDYWSCVVRPLGAARIPFGPGPNGWRRGSHEVTVNALSDAELKNDLKRAVEHLMAAAFRYQPPRIHGGGSPWKSNTYAFIWGGGASHPVYGETFVGSLHDRGIVVHDINRLPSPLGHFLIPDGVDFGRLAVAYGLSYHKANLEPVRLPEELATFDQLYPDYWRDTVEPSSLCTCPANPNCPRCHGTGFVTVSARLVRPFPLHQLGTRLDSTAPAPGPSVRRVPGPIIRAVPTRREPSRFEITLAGCIQGFNESYATILDKVILLQQINAIYCSPRVKLSGRALDVATEFLVRNATGHAGHVQIKSQSARIIKGGCSCLVARSLSNDLVSMRILSWDAGALANAISSSPSPFLTLECTIRKTLAGDFALATEAFIRHGRS